MASNKIILDTNLIKKITEEKISKAQYALDSQILKDSNYYIPFDTGALRDSSIKNSQIGKGVIVWGGKGVPYAKRLYFGSGFKFSRDANPNANSHWFERGKARNGEVWGRIAAKEGGFRYESKK